MFRASDIFGRRPGNEPSKPTVAKAEDDLKRPHGGLTSRTWDPSTGKYYDEALPADIQELLGWNAKKAKVEQGTRVKMEPQEVWGKSSQGNSKAQTWAMGLAQKGSRHAPRADEIDMTAPSVEFKGFSKVDLNDRYYEKVELMINGRCTYWSGDVQFFIYWQGDVQRWSICDAASFVAVKAGQYPGWAYNQDRGQMWQASGWMEAWNGEWREPALEVTYRLHSSSPPKWEDPALLKYISTVDFKGFTMKNLNRKYYLRDGERIQGQPSYWDKSGVYFIYWQQAMSRWAICDLKCLEAVKSGQCPGWAYKSDSGCFADACNWIEQRSGDWTNALIETGVIDVCTRGLKVEIWGFSKKEMNTIYAEKAEEEIQGRASYWDSSGTFFIYWQSSMARWGICDRASLSQAKSGLAPGWAYRTDSTHFARSRNWMEVDGRDWKRTTVTCTILDGNVRDDFHSAVKEEMDAEKAGDALSSSTYATAIRKIYTEKKPNKLAELDRLMAKYKDREHELYKLVCDKYGVDADEFIAKGAEMSAEDEASKHADIEDAPELSARNYAILVQEIYIQHNPKKLQDIAAILAKYRKNERQLYNEVCQKYELHPGKFYAENKHSLDA